MGHGDMEPGEMLREIHRRGLWAVWATMALGFWLLASPFVVNYGSRALAWNDALSGAAIVVLSALSLRENDTLPRWLNALVGIWLLFAPLVFWAPTPFEYNNDTLVGALVIAFTVLVPPGMPGKAHHLNMMKPGPDVPPGWTYNPSTWLQRGPIIALALASFFIARYLAAFQLGHIDQAWDPFFGAGTMVILHSEVSQAWPVSDAGLGALAYLLEALSGFMGGEQRWRTMPWMVLMFGVLVIPLGATSIILVILQPVAVGAWCSLCLLTAALMLVMIPLAFDEVVAMFEFLVLARREGQSVWRVFWTGGTLREVNEDTRTPHLGAPAPRVAKAMVWGVTVPWHLLASVALGLWLMASPWLLGSSGAAADSNHLVGPLVATFAVVAMAEVARPVRFVNVLLGAWLVVAPWALNGFTSLGHWNNVLAGVALILLSILRGNFREHYGPWDRFAKLSRAPGTI